MNMRTQEQQTICQSITEGESLVVNACAGSGKSTTLREAISDLNDSNPLDEILACMYNKAAQLDFEGKLGMSCADVRTMHSLAYRGVVSRSQGYAQRLRGRPHISLQEIVKRLNIKNLPVNDKSSDFLILGAKEGYWPRFLLAKWVKLSIDRFVNSSAPKPLNYNVYIPTVLQFKHKEETAYLESYLLGYVRKFWSMLTDEKSDLPLRHDDYLKIWQLRQPDLNQDYDVVMMDEAQDLNPVFESVLNNFTGQIVYVGDTRQAIYQFRGVVNAMDNALKSVRNVKECLLTQSFRFGPEIAMVANRVLNKQANYIRGNDDLDTIVTPFCTEDKMTVICRTNVGAMETILDHSLAGRQCSFVGNTQAIVNKLISALALSQGRIMDVKDPSIKEFESWEGLLSALDIVDDYDLKLIADLIIKKQSDIPRLIDALDAAGDTPETVADTIVTTAHKSKGREWDHVSLANDFKAIKDEDGNEIIPETNLLYVAATRAQKTLTPNDVLRSVI